MTTGEVFAGQVFKSLNKHDYGQDLKVKYVVPYPEQSRHGGMQEPFAMCEAEMGGHKKIPLRLLVGKDYRLVMQPARVSGDYHG